MRIGLIDVDSHNYPNLPLMKLSAWHKAQGDTVEWYQPFDHFDVVYKSKVFADSPDHNEYINADRVVKGGTGYAIHGAGGETFRKEDDPSLPDEVEHIYPDYSLYNITDTAYGFLTRGCPRGCPFCIVAEKEGRKSYKVADLSEWWNGQKEIILLDPNILACRDRKNLLQQLIDSKAWVDFSQGLDIRMMTEEKAEMLKQIKVQSVHFAWDRYEDKDIVLPKLQKFKDISQWDRRKIIVYCLVGDRERRITPTDMERIMTLRRVGAYPYVMIYDKESLPRGHELKKLQRWVNNRMLWESNETFEQYLL